MAVEAGHLNLFHPQLIGNCNWEMMNPIESSINLYNNQVIGNNCSQLPLSGTTTATGETLLPPPYLAVADSFHQKTAVKSDSCLTYNLHFPSKRSRENSNSTNIYSLPTTQPHKSFNSFSFLGQDITLQVQQQQLDVDNLIVQNMEKVRMEIHEKRKRQAKRIMEAIEFTVMKKLKAKEDEIEKIEKLNWALEERVKSLCMENQIWRDLAQTNEATANALRSNLEQLLAQRGGSSVVDGGTTVPYAGAAVMDDAQSYCGSTDSDHHEDGYESNNVKGWRTLAVCAGAKDKDEGEEVGGGVGYSIGNSSRSSSSRLCRNCGKVESCMLILPCRHLCLCTVCGSTLHTCPVCKSYKTASVHVNMS
ncbi:probable BOI-related E3 ubiquitin-protein ligase 3 [Gastrolobium bilobum]|uniref:probable BOI-related E3 ubiquitin-protein ligase 3 n=1 Tax=Gastrolobium bilobum TaxID=150636 RepID=UPI002AB13213|nr:probable BOI-related E3 ubiquitin-protein ligase 3 [Gastrolobium bilobum]